MLHTVSLREATATPASELGRRNLSDNSIISQHSNQSPIYRSSLFKYLPCLLTRLTNLTWASLGMISMFQTSDFPRIFGSEDPKRTMPLFAWTTPLPLDRHFLLSSRRNKASKRDVIRWSRVFHAHMHRHALVEASSPDHWTTRRP